MREYLSKIKQGTIKIDEYLNIYSNILPWSSTSCMLVTKQIIKSFEIIVPKLVFFPNIILNFHLKTKQDKTKLRLT